MKDLKQSARMFLQTPSFTIAAIAALEDPGCLWMDLRKILANPLRTTGIQPTYGGISKILTSPVLEMESHQSTAAASAMPARDASR